MQKKSTKKKTVTTKTTKTKKTKSSAPKLKAVKAVKKAAPKLKAVTSTVQKMATVTTKPAASKPAPSSQTKDARNWSMYCHLAAFSGFIIPLGFILGPLIVWLMKRDEYPAVEKHGKAALNFQISMTIYFIISVLLAFIVIGYVFLVALVIMEIVFVVLASIKAQEGGFYEYPLTIHFVK
jgi:uncharacterized Tic20 family protein